MRKIHDVRDESRGVVVKVYRDAEWNEYVVKLYVGGEFNGDYRTDDKQDAIDTADSIARPTQA